MSEPESTLMDEWQHKPEGCSMSTLLLRKEKGTKWDSVALSVMGREVVS